MQINSVSFPRLELQFHQKQKSYQDSQFNATRKKEVEHLKILNDIFKNARKVDSQSKVKILTSVIQKLRRNLLSTSLLLSHEIYQLNENPNIYSSFTHSNLKSLSNKPISVNLLLQLLLTINQLISKRNHKNLI